MMTTIAVFVIAHPDDESMFFLPTICGLPNNHKRWLLCLSNGNYNGLGTTREIELHRAGGYVGFDRIVVINHDELQDSPTQRWSMHAVARVLEELLLLPLSTSDTTHVVLYTFDAKGVSGHINHVDTYLGVRFYLQTMDRTLKGTVQGFQLMTENNLLRKYFPLLHWVGLLCTLFGSIWRKSSTQNTTTTAQPTRTHSTLFTLYQPWINWKCMASHASQFVWYRRLFVVFSCYTYENRWRPIRTAQ